MSFRARQEIYRNGCEKILTDARNDKYEFLRVSLMEKSCSAEAII